MSSRGSLIKNGHVTTDEYITVKITEKGVKILQGDHNNHSLPDYSHSPNSIYAKLKKDMKTLHEMRFYNNLGNLIIEIGYHPEPKLNNGNRIVNVLHFHVYDGLFRGEAKLLANFPEIKSKYKKYLEEFGLND